uniref:KASH domain-containing protein n=1 Tax=Esox lucius TaxID=8010 RepID=A0A3P8ZXV1_ESOLU
MPLPVDRQGDECPCHTGSGLATQSVNSPLASDLLLETTEPLFSNSQFLPLQDICEESQDCMPLGTCLTQDGCSSLDGCIQLERKWVLWHEFMKEYYSLNDWLRLAEQSADSPRTAFVPFVTAKEELKKFENLRSQAGSRLAQLDSLTQRNRALTRMFDGAMRSRLASMTRDCGQRWDRLSGTMECVCRRLRHCVSQREEFDNQREEMAVWLADMDLRTGCLRRAAPQTSEIPRAPLPPRTTWCWSGTPLLILGARFPTTMQIHHISAPTQVGKEIT